MLACTKLKWDTPLGHDYKCLGHGRRDVHSLVSVTIPLFCLTSLNFIKITHTLFPLLHDKLLRNSEAYDHHLLLRLWILWVRNLGQGQVAPCWLSSL